MPQLPMRPMSMGETLDRSFQLYRRHFRVLLLTAVCGYVPIALLYAVAGVPAGALDWTGGAAVALALMVLLILVTVLIWAALSHQVGQAVMDAPVDIASGVRRGLAALLPMIGLGILGYLLLLGVLLLTAVPVGIGVAVAAPAGNMVGLVATAMIAVVLASFALLWWGAMVFLAVPALVLERIGPLRALKRGNALAKQGRVRVTVLATIAWLIVTLPTLGGYVMLGMGSALWDPEALYTLSTTQIVLQQLMAFGVGAVTTPYLVAVAVLAYYDQRVRREGYDVELATPQSSPAS